MKEHPLPWRVEYVTHREEWSKKSLPYIVDANGDKVCEMIQHVSHPGTYDKQADDAAHLIVKSVNSYECYERLQLKVSHGCTDASCEECDG